MSRRIVADLRRLSGLAATLNGLAQQAEALKGNLASAVRPAERGDVPELAEITAGHMSARAAIAKVAGDIAGQVAAIRHYTQALARVETILAIYRYQLYLQAFRPVGFNPFGFAATSGGLKGPGPDDPGVQQLQRDLLDIAVGVGIDNLPGLPTTDKGALALEKIGFLHAKAFAVQKAFIPLTIVRGFGTAFDEKKAAGARLGGAMEGSVAVVGAGGSLLQVGGTAFGSSTATSAGAAMSGAASAAAWPVVAYTVTYAVGSHYQSRFEADDAAGRSSAQRIGDEFISNLTRPGVTPTRAVAVAGETGIEYGLLGVNRAAKALAQQIYPEAPPPDEIDGHTQATLLAHFKQFHPDARVVPLDGTFLVKLPNAAGNVDVIRVDNDELRTR